MYYDSLQKFAIFEVGGTASTSFRESIESPDIAKALGKQLQTRIIEVELLLKMVGYLCSALMIRLHGSVHVVSSIHVRDCHILTQ